jgi:putative membrane protein
MFETGFMGTRALLYMDIVTLFFAILPFLVAYSISFAIRGDIKKHYLSQISIFVTTILMVVVFEVGVRFSGGYVEFIKSSSVNFTFLTIFLIVHIIIALATVILWVIQLYSAMSHFKSEGAGSSHFAKHKRIAKWLFSGIVITSIMGCMIYLFLFTM